MTPVRLGAVAYLNARPLVFDLERSDLFTVRFDTPAVCAVKLAEGRLDLGTIPSIEYQRGSDYRIVPGVAIASRGDVASVAVYTRRAVSDVLSVAVDTSSRTSVALLHVLCARAFGINPVLEPMAPDLDTMLSRCDAALIIGDRSLFLDHEAVGLRKIDLGRAWTAMTGRPFVWALWVGRPGGVDASGVLELQAARDAGVAASDSIAAEYVSGNAERAAIARRYLRENMWYALDEEATAGLLEFFRLAGELDLAPQPVALRYY